MNDNKAYYGVMLTIAVVICVFVGGFFYLRGATYTVHLTVRALDWQRIQSIERFTALYQDTYRSSMPADAYNIYLYSSVSCHSQKIGNMISQSCSTSYHARYWINRWVWAYDLTTTGKPGEDRYYAKFLPTGNGELGSERPGQQREYLWVHFDCKDHNTPLDYPAPDDPTWRMFTEGQHYTVSVNRLEWVLWETLSKENQQ